MMKYEILLFDADGTLLDFDAGEAVALKDTFAKFNLPYADRTLAVYRANNHKQWLLFEQGKKDKQQVLFDRFTDTFAELSINEDVDTVAHYFQKQLGLQCQLYEDTVEVLDYFKGKVDMYLVSNGVLATQQSRMSKSGLDKYFTASFISEYIGYAKPSKQYFDYCFEHIANFERSKTLIIGDSLSADIKGGIDNGIDTCWVNRHSQCRGEMRPTYEIASLKELYKIVENTSE